MVFLLLATPSYSSIEFGFTACPNTFVILSIKPNSFAEYSGLKFGDQIKEINGKRIASLNEIARIGANANIGDKITFLVNRGKSGSSMVQLIYKKRTQNTNTKTIPGLDALKSKISNSLSTNVKVTRYNGSSPATFNFNNCPVKVHFGTHTLYANEGYYLKHIPIFIEYNGKLAIENKYIKCNDMNICIEYKSTNDNAIVIDDKGDAYAKAAGNASIIISDKHSALELPFDIIQIPIPAESDKDKLIQVLGLPDYQKKLHIPWTKSLSLDNIHYMPKSDQVNGIFIEHWKYNKYPNAIFRFFDNNILHDITSPEVEELPIMKHMLEYK